MLGGFEFGFLSGVFFFFPPVFHNACHQFLSILHDKMGQNFSLGEHILSYLLYNKRKMETFATLGSSVS